MSKINYDGTEYTADELLSEAMLWDTINAEKHEALHDAALILQGQRDDAYRRLAEMEGFA